MTRDNAIQLLLDSFDAGTKFADTMYRAFPSKAGAQSHTAWMERREEIRKEIVDALGSDWEIVERERSS